MDESSQTILTNDQRRETLKCSIWQLQSFYSSLQSRLETKGERSSQLEKPADPSLEFILTQLDPKQMKPAIQQINKIEKILTDSDFQDILSILRNKKKMFKQIKEFETFDSQILKKSRDMELKRNNIRSLEEEKTGFGIKMGKIRQEMEEVRRLMQKELEANFKANFLIVNS